ncbi:MAG: hypothetical protein COT84_08155 [Chlamydiae bacterium CG10_big_fil_rev_8_21_14_0_10_35_9]|nr:MAG: hypothetical protein COT84_08155 [Chlamydiae bacterium CG10_big_fil_rev_8_21_14_0_10_35_9]
MSIPSGFYPSRTISHLPPEERVKILSYLTPQEQLMMRGASRAWNYLSQERLGQFAFIQSIAGTCSRDIEKLYDNDPKAFEVFLDRTVNTNFNLVSDSDSRVMGKFFYNVLYFKSRVNIEEMMQWLRKLPPQKRALIEEFNYYDITDRQLAEVIELCPNLKKLHLINTNITGEGLSHIPENNQLEYVSLSSPNLDKAFLSTFFSRATKLKSLWLVSPIAGEILSHIPKNNQLEKVDLDNSTLKENHLIEFFSKATMLKEVNLSHSNITGKCLNFIVSDQLEAIILSYCEYLDEKWLVKFFSNAATLKRIDLTLSSTTGEGISHIPINNQLQTLVLRYCEFLDERYLIGLLPNATLLRELDVSKTSITGQCLVHISVQNQLERLRLRDCKRLNEALLREILLKATMLTELDISETAITGQVLVDISEHTQLEELIFYNCKKLDEALVWEFFLKANKIKKLHSKSLSDSLIRKITIFEMLVRRNGNVKLHQQPKEVINFLHDLPLSSREMVLSLDFANSAASYMMITEEEIATLLQLCPNLKFLAVGGKVTGEGLSHISEDNQLEKLFFYSWNPDEGFLAQFFSKAKKIKEVKFNKTTGVGLSHLPEGNQLEKIDFYESENLDEKALATLFAKISFLKEVNFFLSSVTGEGLSRLLENNRLEKVSFVMCKQLKEEALKKLFAKTPFLKEVKFDSSKTTFEGLLHLPGDTQLEKLSLRYCNIDAEIFNALISKAAYLNNIDHRGASIKQKNKLFKAFKKIFGH